MCMQKAKEKQGRWITDGASLQKREEPNKWLMRHNELYQDADGSVYLVPRRYITDNYTIPDWIAFLAGSKSKYDSRPAHIHDFGCQFHQLIRVALPVEEIISKYCYYDDGLFTCKDIPIKHLEIVPVSKWQIDCLFKRAMRATKAISPYTYSLYRGGVFFNFGWLGNHPPFNLSKIYTIEQNNS